MANIYEPDYKFQPDYVILQYKYEYNSSIQNLVYNLMQFIRINVLIYCHIFNFQVNIFRTTFKSESKMNTCIHIRNK